VVSDAAAAASMLATTRDIISETVTVLRYRRGFQAALSFLTEIKLRHACLASTGIFAGSA
jgi:hypothetical protein